MSIKKQLENLFNDDKEKTKLLEKIKTLEEELVIAKDRVSGYNDVVEENEKRVLRDVAEIRNLMENLGKKQVETEELKKLLEEEKDKNKDVIDKLDNRTIEYEESLKKVEDIQKEMENKANTFKNEINRYKEQNNDVIMKLNEQIENLFTEITEKKHTNNENVKKYNNHITTLNVQIDKLQVEVQRQKTELTDLELQLNYDKNIRIHIGGIDYYGEIDVVQKEIDRNYEKMIEQLKQNSETIQNYQKKNRVISILLIITFVVLVAIVATVLFFIGAHFVIALIVKYRYKTSYKEALLWEFYLIDIRRRRALSIN